MGHPQQNFINLEALKQVGPTPTLDTLGGNEFAQLRKRIDELEFDAHSPAKDRDAAEAPATQVTATVTGGKRRRKSEGVKEQHMTNTTQATTNSNAPKWDDLVAIARQLGGDKGNGKDAQIKFGLKIIEAAYLGALTLDANKHGEGMRDGKVLAEEYMKAQQGAVIFDAKADNVRKLVSNLDKCIKLGTCPKWGQGQPLQAVNDLMTWRQQEKKAGKKVDDAFNTLMRFATQQLKRDTIIDGAELKAFVYKRDPGHRSAEDVLDSVRKTLNALKNGKVSNCPDQDMSKEVQDAVKALNKRLADIARAKGGQAAPAAQAAA